MTDDDDGSEPAAIMSENHCTRGHCRHKNAKPTIVEVTCGALDVSQPLLILPTQRCHLGENVCLMPTGKIKRPSVELMCSCILDAWCSLPADLIAKSFKNTGIANALDGSEDDQLWEQDYKVASDLDDPGLAILMKSEEQ
ncbi:hypothetical protein HPB52_022039 [Rhipicephalus sanguineus]|uniref:Uncharacterized protein n=1 Tax=Rhipicephalus sanguineus TaxID=34632 RepID=A0A9D4PSN4_RHISA|nr:hypothetical protein HPB52_022039 [Rhipicephalus sanguineus]